MKQILILLLSLVLSTQLYSQSDSTAMLNDTLAVQQLADSEISFVSYWNKKDSYDFKITKIKQRWKDGELTKNDSSAYIANFEVLDSTDKSYTIKWRIKSNLENIYQLPQGIDLSQIKNDISEIIYTTTELGEFNGVENWEGIKKMINEVLDITSKSLSENEQLNEKSLNDFKALITSLYGSKQGFEYLLFKEIPTFHFPFGLIYNTKDTIKYEDELPNLISGKPIAADGMVYFESVDFDREHCVMIQELSMNEADMKDVILTVFKKLGLKDEEMEEASKDAQFLVRDKNTYEYYYFPGVPIKIESQREILMNMGKENGRNIDRLIIELMD